MDRWDKSGELPVERLASPERLDRRIAERQIVRQLPFLPEQSHSVGVSRQAVKIRAMVTGKTLEFVESPGRLEGFGVELERRRCREAASTADRLLLQRGRMRSTVGAEKELGAARSGGSYRLT